MALFASQEKAILWFISRRDLYLNACKMTAESKVVHWGH